MITHLKPSDPHKRTHDYFAPYWAAALALFLGAGLVSVNFDLGHFERGYLIDMVGPAWNYILFRGLFTTYANNIWTRFFTPTRTFIIFILVSFGIEGAQYFQWYESTFDPWDLLAYLSILLPLFIIDSLQYWSNKT